MDRFSGHKTTFDEVRERADPYQATAVAGQKRTYPTSPSDNVDGSGALTANAYPTSHKRHGSAGPAKPNLPPRLTPSRIVDIAPEDGVPRPDDSVHGEVESVARYSQRQTIAATPTTSVDPALSLAHPCYRLPEALVANTESMGIRSIYPWQKQCLLAPGLLSGERNLVYSAPTGGGKSLVADVLMLKRILAEPESKALLVLPYVALVHEKVRWLQRAVDGIRRGDAAAADDDEEESQSQKLRREDKPEWLRRRENGIVNVVGFFGGSKARHTWNDFDIGVCTIEKVGFAAFTL